MRALVISNDVVPGFGVPVAAPGLRAQGLAAGLRANDIPTDVVVPADVLAIASGSASAALPSVPGVHVAQPTEFMDLIGDGGYDVAVFINANMGSVLHPINGVRFVFDMFAPKVLETLASASTREAWNAQVANKERALGLADRIWVNGRRKVGYALGWLLRPAVDQWRTEFGRPTITKSDLDQLLQVVEMPVVAPPLDPPSPLPASSSMRRLGIAGYAQAWSALERIHPGHQALVDHGHSLHALVPTHWGGPNVAAPPLALPEGTIQYEGPLALEDFYPWVQSMDAMVDLFDPTPERRFAMITRSVVALRLGIPVVHGVDSEVADIIREYDAGWVVTSHDADEWRGVAADLQDEGVLRQKQLGAQRASVERFDPAAALQSAARALTS